MSHPRRLIDMALHEEKYNRKKAKALNFLKEKFEAIGYLRHHDPEKYKTLGYDVYKKGSEVRFVTRSEDELQAIREAISTLGYTVSKPFLKQGRKVQPIYGSQIASEFYAQHTADYQAKEARRQNKKVSLEARRALMAERRAAREAKHKAREEMREKKRLLTAERRAAKEALKAERALKAEKRAAQQALKAENAAKKWTGRVWKKKKEAPSKKTAPSKKRGRPKGKKASDSTPSGKKGESAG